MLPFDAHPVLSEARALARERRRVRIAAETEDPEVAAVHQTELEQLSARIDELLSDPAHRALINSQLDERARTLRIAVAARQEELELRQRLEQADDIVAQAIAEKRSLTASENERITSLRQPFESTLPEMNIFSWRHGVTSVTRRDGVLEALGSLRLREARSQLHNGLLLTSQMRSIISEALPALLRGDPVLLIGETGCAKTALAEYLARRCMGLEPEFISGYGDITSAQVIGAHELRAEDGASVSAFMPGPMLRAMTEGRPVILDELNAMPAEFLKRLNRILQLRPGDPLSVQENGGREVRIEPGFVILATANDQTPHRYRYRGIERLSAELVNRFGANGYRVHYPDSGVAYEGLPAENALLAAAAIVDRHGELPSGIDVDQLLRVSRAAFISQQVFAGSHGAGFDDYVSTEREIDGRPGLDEAVLAPRTLVSIVQKVAGSAGSITLDRALTRFVESVMHRDDRRVLALMIESQGFRLG